MADTQTLSGVRAYSDEPGRITVTTSYRDQPARGSSDEEFLLLMRKRFHTSADTESSMRSEQLIDQRFMASEQWPDSIKADRDQDGRPCITINRLPVFKSQVTNQQRQAKPAIQINPVDSRSDPKTAEVLQGIIRHIENQSNADIAYDTACDAQVTIGRGFFRVLVDWDDVDPWQQNILIKRIRNPFTVFFDPACQEFDYSDARYCFIVEDIPKEEFVAKYGIDPSSAIDLFAMQGDRAPDWMPEGKVRVAEYFYVDVEQEKIALLSNGEQFPAAVLDSEEMKEWMLDVGITVLRTRTREKRTVKWAKVTGSKVLERRDWPGKWIPVIPVIGVELDINGRVDLRGMVRDARDPQRMYNYWVSAETEAIALAPKTPFIGAEGQFEGHEPKWKLANRRNFAYLEYKLKTAADQLVPPPQRQVLEPPIAAIVAATKQADNDLKAVTGFYDASLGERGPEQSGKAILARQRQGDMTNSHWVDNLVRALKFLGKQLIDLIPKVYDTPRVMRILGLDNQPLTVMVHSNMPQAVPSVDEGLAQGIQGIYDLSTGRFDVTVSVGPRIESRRQEAVEAMSAFIQAFPAAAPVIGDVLAENMDWPGATTVAKRLRKMVPPEVLESGPEGFPPEAQAMVLQLQQQVQQLQQSLQQAAEIIRTKKTETDSRERIAQMDNETKLLLAQMDGQIETVKVQAQQAKTVAEAQKAVTEAKAAEGQTLIDLQKGQADVQKVRAETQIKGAQLEQDWATTAAELQADVVMQQMEQEHEVRMLEMQQDFEARQAAREREFQASVEVHKADTTKEVEKQRGENAKAVAKARPKGANPAARARRPGGK